MNTSKSESAEARDSRKDGGPASGCCGGPAPKGTSACCAQDAEVKSAGGAGCGCSAASATASVKKTARCG